MNLKSIGIVTVLVIGTFFFSFTMQKERAGVLVLAHGGTYSNWDTSILDAIEPLKKQYPVEIAFGMSNPVSMQKAIDKLESQGVGKIVVVQLFISSFSPIIRQNEYLLGIRKELADAPMIMDHSMSGHNEHQDHHSSNPKNEMTNNVDLKPLSFKSEIILTKPLDDHPLVAEILLDRIMELSEQSANETVLIVAHGPNDESDNKNWISTMDNISDQIRNKKMEKGERFKQIFCLTVRDDADKAVYDQAKEQLRTLVYQAGKDGDVIVIPLLLAKGGVEQGYVKRLEGLEYKWSGETLVPHPNITEFIQTSVEEALK